MPIMNTSKPISPEFSSPKTGRWLFLLLLSAFLIRLPDAGLPLANHNAQIQAAHAVMAQSFADGSPLWQPTLPGWPEGEAVSAGLPLYAWLLAALHGLAGEAAWPGRWLSILSLIGSAWLLTGWLRERWSGWAAVFACGWLLASPMGLFFGHAVQPAALHGLLITGGLFVLLREGDRFSWPSAVGGALLFGAGVAMVPATLLLLIPAGWMAYTVSGTVAQGGKRIGLLTGASLAITLGWLLIRGESQVGPGAITFHLDQLVTPHYWLAAFESLMASAWIAWAVVFALTGCIWDQGNWRKRLVWPLWLLAGGLVWLGCFSPGATPQAGMLWVALPLAALAGVGLDRMAAWVQGQTRMPMGLGCILLIALSVWTWIDLHGQGWFERQTPYAREAAALSHSLPEDARIAVWDPHGYEPALFYFIDRPGFSYAAHASDRTNGLRWVEAMRNQGATHAVGIVHPADPNPIAFFQTAPLGNHLAQQYAVAGMGIHHWVVDLPQTQAAERTMPSEPYAESDEAVSIDFHRASREQFAQFKERFQERTQAGWAVTRAQHGTWKLAPSEAILPATKAIHAIYSSGWHANREPGQIGMTAPGEYAVSVALPERIENSTCHLAVNSGAETLAERNIETNNSKRIDRHTLLIQLEEAQPLDVVIQPSGSVQPVTPESVVCLPDVRTLPLPLRLEAEQLNLNHAREIVDANARFNTTLWGYDTGAGRFFCHGGYFHFPHGRYQARFRVRQPRDWSQGDLQVGFYENAVVWQIVRNVYTPLLEPTYQFIDVEAYIPANYTVELRAWIHEQTEVLLDTIEVQQLQRDPWRPQEAPVVRSLAAGEALRQVRASGSISNASDEPLGKHWPRSPLVYAYANASGRVQTVDAQGRVYDESGQLREEATALDTPILARQEAEAGGWLTIWADGRVLLPDGQEDQIEAPPFPLRDIELMGQAGAFLLFGNGQVIAVGNAEPVTQSPNFGVDAARALVPAGAERYLVDCTGAIHSLNGAPLLRSPHYREEDWIADAGLEDSGAWWFLTRSDERLTFSPASP